MKCIRISAELCAFGTGAPSDCCACERNKRRRQCFQPAHSRRRLCVHVYRIFYNCNNAWFGETHAIAQGMDWSCDYRNWMLTIAIGHGYPLLRIANGFIFRFSLPRANNDKMSTSCLRLYYKVLMPVFVARWMGTDLEKYAPSLKIRTHTSIMKWALAQNTRWFKTLSRYWTGV